MASNHGVSTMRRSRSARRDSSCCGGLEQRRRRGRESVPAGQPASQLCLGAEAVSTNTLCIGRRRCSNRRELGRRHEVTLAWLAMSCVTSECSTTYTAVLQSCVVDIIPWVPSATAVYLVPLLWASGDPREAGWELDGGRRTVLLHRAMSCLRDVCRTLESHMIGLVRWLVVRVRTELCRQWCVRERVCVVRGWPRGCGLGVDGRAQGTNSRRAPPAAKQQQQQQQLLLGTGR
jgi:hypothetical protein